MSKLDEALSRNKSQEDLIRGLQATIVSLEATTKEIFREANDPNRNEIASTIRRSIHKSNSIKAGSTSSC